jgi:hypothetical protein
MMLRRRHSERAASKRMKGVGTMRKLPVLLAALVSAAVALATAAATAGGPPVSSEMLKFFSGGDGTIAWSSEGGSSTAGDHQALRMSGTTQGIDYAGAYAIAATSEDVPLSDVNASFDIKGYEGAGSPRISLPIDTNGDEHTDMWAYLSASYCSGDARTTASAGFEHVDFQKSGCTIYTSTATVLNGLSDALDATGSIAYRWGGFTFDVTDTGPRAAWKVASDEQPFLILDEAPAVSYVDNLTIGAFNWRRPGRIGFADNVSPPDKVHTDGGTMHWSNGSGDSFDVTVNDVTIAGGVVAFSGAMGNGAGQWAGYEGKVIQEYLDTNTGLLYGLIGGPDVAPASTTGLEGPFAYTGTVNVS